MLDELTIVLNTGLDGCSMLPNGAIIGSEVVKVSIDPPELLDVGIDIGSGFRLLLTATVSLELLDSGLLLLSRD